MRRVELWNPIWSLVDPAQTRMYIPCIYIKEGEMITKVQKWGNSLGLRIPKSLAEGAHVKEGSTVYLALEDGRLVVKPTEVKAYKLQDLLAKVTDENLHAEISTGHPVGKEAW